MSRNIEITEEEIEDIEEAELDDYDDIDECCDEITEDE